MREATRQCNQEEHLFSILTDKGANLGGEVRQVELHPWVTKTGHFGLWPVKRPLLGNQLSENAYEFKSNLIKEYSGKWVRRTTIEKALVVIPLPQDAELGEPRWPKVLLDGDWETIITRAFANRWIKSLDDKTARNL